MALEALRAVAPEALRTVALEALRAALERALGDSEVLGAVGLAEVGWVAAHRLPQAHPRLPLSLGEAREVLEELEAAGSELPPGAKVEVALVERQVDWLPWEEAPPSQRSPPQGVEVALQVAQAPQN